MGDAPNPPAAIRPSRRRSVVRAWPDRCARTALGAVIDDAAAVHHHRARRDVERQPRVLLDQDQSPAPLGCVSRFTARASSSTITGARPSDGSSISSTRRIADQRAADRQHLLLAARQLIAPVVGALGQAAETARTPSRSSRVPAAPPLRGFRATSAREKSRAPAARSQARRRRAGRSPSSRYRCRAARARPPCSVVWPMMVASSVVLPTPLRPMIDTVSLGAERKANVLQHDGLAVAGADVFEVERPFSHGAPPRWPS